jgi:hypothetical protein
MVPTGAKSATPPKQKKCTFCGGEGWWMDAMGTNSYRCDECQNPAVSDHIVEAEIAERELSATKDEYCKTAFALTEQTERAEKAEAEVERLRSQLKRAVEIAEIGIKYLDTGGDWDSEAFPKDTGWVTDEEIEEWQRKLDSLKEEIK